MRGLVIRTRSRRWGLLALVLALAMRLLVPAGFMWAPATDGSGAPELILCFGTAPAPAAEPMSAMPGMAGMAHAATAHADHHGGSHKGDSAGDHECAFAAFAGAIATADLAFATLAPLAPAITLPAILLADLAPGRGLAAPPPPQRGPPATF